MLLPQKIEEEHVAEFDDVFHVVFVRVLQNSLDALGLGRFGFHFKRHTFAFHPDEEVQLKTWVFQEVVQVLLLFVKRVSHQILEDGAFESSQVALQDVRPGPGEGSQMW